MQSTNNSTAASPSPSSGCYTGQGPVAAGSDLYRYDSSSGQLHDLTVDHSSDPVGADVLGVLGISGDGSYVYFVANGVLAANAGAEGSHASQGDCGAWSTGTVGTCNLYLSQNWDGNLHRAARC